MPSDKRNLIMAKATGLIFHCSTLLLPDMRLLQYLPVSSFVSHSSLLTVKGVDLVIVHGGFPL